MAILTTADFTDSMVISELNRNSAFIDDEKVLVHYYNLLKLFSISRDSDDLPDTDSISQAVKNYLIICINLDVCYSSKAGNLNRTIDGIEVDQWGLKIKGYLEYKTMMMQTISSQDIYSEVPDPDDSSNTSVMSWGRA